MTLFYSHRDRLRETAGGSRLYPLARRTIARISAAFRIFHQAIVTAKTRRIQRELMFHEIPQRPLILDDKWDF
jgi:DNA-binding transcriptional LysR family regulator